MVNRIIQRLDERPSLTSSFTQLQVSRFSRRTVLIGLASSVVAGCGAGLGLSQWLQFRTQNNSFSASSPSVNTDSNSFPLHFTEIVAFRGDFGGTEVVSPKGMAYHPILDKLIVSLSPYTVPNGHRVQILNTVADNGARARFAPDYKTYRDVESMIAIVPQHGPPVDAGFTPGDIFVGRGPGDEISHLSSNGQVISDVWADPGTKAGLWGGLVFDTVGTFGGKLIALTIQGKIFLIDTKGAHTALADVGQAIRQKVMQRLEGVEVAPSKFGPLGGQIVVSVEGRNDTDPQSGKIYACDQKGAVQLLADIGYAGESLAFVPPNGGTYYQEELSTDRERENRLLRASASQFLTRLGDMIVVNEYTGELWDISWNGTHYTTSRIGRAPDRWSSEGIEKQATELEVGCFAVRSPHLSNWTDWSSIAGTFTTNNVPSAFVDVNGKVHLLAVSSNDQRIYISTLSTSTPHWIELPPGGFTTNYSLTSVTYDMSQYTFAVQHDGAIMYKRPFLYFVDQNALTSEPWQEVPGGLHTNAAIAATVSNGRLALCAKGTDQQLYLNQLEPGGRGDWSGWQLVPGEKRTDSSPALASFQDELYIFIRERPSGRILTKVLVTNEIWTDWAEVPHAGITNSSIVAITLAGQLYLFAQGTHDQKLYWNVASETGTWSLWQNIPSSTLTATPYAVTATTTQLYLFAKGAKNQQLYMRHTN